MGPHPRWEDQLPESLDRQRHLGPAASGVKRFRDDCRLMPLENPCSERWTSNCWLNGPIASFSERPCRRSGGDWVVLWAAGCRPPSVMPLGSPDPHRAIARVWISPTAGVLFASPPKTVRVAKRVMVVPVGTLPKSPPGAPGEIPILVASPRLRLRTGVGGYTPDRLTTSLKTGDGEAGWLRVISHSAFPPAISHGADDLRESSKPS